MNIRDFKPQIQEVTRSYFHSSHGKAPNCEFLSKMCQLKQSHEFFNKIENQLEQLINAEVQKHGCNKYLIVDVKVQDQFLPPWLSE